MSETVITLETGDDVLELLEGQSTELLMFDNDYCVLRVASEPATDQMVDVNPHLLLEMWQVGVLDGTILEYGMSYRATRD